MCEKSKIRCGGLTCSTFFVLMLSLILTGAVGAADPDLVGWWKFEEESGTLYDQSDNHNDATSFDGVLYQQPGREGYALGFDGVDDRVVVGTTGRPTDTFSFGCWLKTSVTNEIDPESIAGVGGVAGQRYVFDPRHGGETEGGAGLSVGTNGILVYEHGSNYMPATAVYEAEIGSDWNHIMIVYDNKQPTIYLNGAAVRTGLPSPRAVVNAPIQIGGMAYGFIEGLIDEVRIYSRALSAAEVKTIAGRVEAFSPTPADGATYPETWVTLGWSAGAYAASHDVYLGESFDDVSNGTADTFRGSQASENLIVGFAGFPYPDGLVPGTTYYWRVDEVNDNEPNSPWKGDVWSFSVPPRTAYDPSVPDGSSFVDPDVELSWTPGFGARLHTVYFGDDLDTVANAAGGVPQPTTTFTPGTLELDKTFYWRVDEFDVFATHKGDIWSFTTTLPGLGKAIATRWENITTADINALKTNARYPDMPDVTEEVTEFAWDGPDLSDYGGRIEAWVHVPSTGDFTFWLNTDNQGELWLSTDDDPGSARLIALESSWSPLNSWGSGEERSDPIPLIGGEKYYMMAIWKEAGGGDHCQVAWQGPGVPQRTVIAGTYLSPFEPLSAYGAKPSNRSVDVTQVPILTWKAGLHAASHEVYFGTDEQAVADAAKASPEYKGSRQLGSESLDPGKLEWNTTYFWRVDEIDNANPDSPWVGNVWSFTTADFLIVDDFESYDDIDPPPGEPGLNRIFDKWIDGFGTLTNGALVGNDLPPYAEQTIVHGGSQSMNYAYDNAGKTSEATLTLVYPRDWTEGGVTKLSLWVNGSAGNAADRIYVALNGTAVVYHDDASATQIADWTEWAIDLAAFGVNLTNVNTITIGVGTKNAPSPTGGQGTMYFDDIRLIR